MVEDSSGRKEPSLVSAAAREQLLLVAPLFLFYHLGLLFGGQGMNGVDFFTRIIGALFHWKAWPYVLLMAVLTVAYVVWLRRSRSSGGLRKGRLPLLLLESAFYAVLMGPLTVLILKQSHLLGTGVGALGFADRLVASAGAGFYEELVFRLGLVGGGSALLVRAGKSRGRAVFFAALVSAPLFALAHHLGPGAEPFALAAFAFRTLLGLMLAVLFLLRGFARAAWCHFFYDVFVLCLGRA